jgi:hypothetical protein
MKLVNDQVTVYTTINGNCHDKKTPVQIKHNVVADASQPPSQIVHINGH